MPVTISSAPPVKPRVSRKQTEEELASIEKASARAGALNGIAQTFQVPLVMFGRYADATALGIHGPAIVSQLVPLADSYERIAAVVDPLIKIGPFTALIAAVIPFAAQIAVNAGFMRAGVAGTVPPVVLSAKMEASLAKAEMEALLLQKDAEQEAVRIRSEIQTIKSAASDQSA
jgi:hypothetical protein